MGGILAEKGPILVTGGAGYIGSHTCKRLASLGWEPVTYDDLSTGNRDAVRWGPLVVADVADRSRLCEAIERYSIATVIHFAASAYVGESIANPRKYFSNNLTKTISLLDTLLDSGVREIIFSSTCATYGMPQQLPIAENHPQLPVNPYGESKLAIEKVLRWYGEAYGLKWISLRYFNAAGADPDGDIGECHREESHLIPLAIQSVLPGGQPLRIFGSDYATSDGTAVRDYVHVSDLANAHALAVQFVREGKANSAFNLGVGKGYSVREVLATIYRVTGRTPVALECERRAGDPPILVADPSRAHRELCWSAQHSNLSEIVSTAWQWFKARHDAPIDVQAKFLREAMAKR